MKWQTTKSFYTKTGNILVPTVILIFLTIFTYSQIITIGGSGEDNGASIIQTKDGGYAIVGFTNSFGQGGDDVYIVKIDNIGKLEWTRVVGGPDDERANAIIQTDDSSFVVVGYTYSFGKGNSDIYLIKLDTSGTVKWTKTIGGTNSETGITIIQTSDGGLAIAGGSYIPGQSTSNLCVVKLNSSANMQWARIIGVNNSEFGTSIVETNDGGFIALGFTNVASSGQGNYDLYLVKLDASGSLLWSKTLGGALYEEPSSIAKTRDGGYIISGVTNSFGQGNYDIYIVKLDSTADIQWAKSFGGSQIDGGNKVIQTQDGGYFIAGNTASFGQGSYDIYALKLNSLGDIIWTKTIGGISLDLASSVVEVDDGSFIITGKTYSFGQGSSDIYLMQLTKNGFINTGNCGGISYGGAVDTGGTITPVSSSIFSWGTMLSHTSGVDTGGVVQICIPLSLEHKTTNSSITAKWHPGAETIVLKLQGLKFENPFSVEIFDTKGNLIAGNNYYSVDNTVKIPVGDINSGIYIVRVITREGTMFFSKVFVY